MLATADAPGNVDPHVDNKSQPLGVRAGNNVLPNHLGARQEDSVGDLPRGCRGLLASDQLLRRHRRWCLRRLAHRLLRLGWRRHGRGAARIPGGTLRWVVGRNHPSIIRQILINRSL